MLKPPNAAVLQIVSFFLRIGKTFLNPDQVSSASPGSAGRMTHRRLGSRGTGVRGRSASPLRRTGDADRGAEIDGFHQLAVAHDKLHLPEIADVLLRVAADRRAGEERGEWALDAAASDDYTLLMRTTLDIDDDILEAAKALARQTRRTAGSVLSDLARDALTGFSKSKKKG